MSAKSNQLSEPMRMSVTTPAEQEIAPATRMAHLQRSAKKNSMILPREKAQVVFAFGGLAFLGMALALMQLGARGSTAIIPSQNRGIGFWKEHGISVEAGRKIGPWFAAAGIASLVAAYAIPER